jgi:MoaA/NifB/PqqE/SkfB family radical SAM enzyme
MRSGLLPVRVVHVHPTRTCNLACAHCYSESSPGVRGSLGADVLLDALARLRREGYENVSISGGEPLVYRELDRLAAGARDQGYHVHLITNGILLTEQRLATLRPHVDLIGVSLDGSEVTHNAVRGRADAFKHAIRALHVLADAEMPFGIVFGVSAHSLVDVPWAFEQARALGAKLLHLRPLAPEGRAKTLPDEWTLSHEDCARLIVLTELLRGVEPEGPRVQVDLMAHEDLGAARDQFELLRSMPNVTTLSDAVNPLVIDEQGRWLPFVYGLDAAFEIEHTTVDEQSTTNHSATARLQHIGELLRSAFDEAERDGAAYLDWFAHLARVSRRLPVVTR